MKKAFTLIELLVVIAIIAILAAILFPVFAQAKDAAKKTEGLSNYKQVATATMIYSTDYDDLFPRAFTIRADGTARYNVIHPYPNGWNTADAVWQAPDVLAENAGYWANALLSYTKNAEIMELKGGTNLRSTADNASFAIPASAARARRQSVTYNGLLHTLSQTSIENVSIVPLYWAGNGKGNREGRALANPALLCSGAASTVGTCLFGPTSGPGYAWFWTGYSSYVHARGFNYARTDSSAKFTQAGNVTGASPATPNSNGPNSPFAHILTGGIPQTMWGCSFTGAPSYACWFRPDRTQ